MPDDPNQIAGAFVKITADLSELETSMQAAVAETQTVANQLSQDLSVAFMQATQTATDLSSTMQALGLSAEEAAALLSGAGIALQGVSVAAQTAATGIQQMTLGFSSGLNDLGTQTSLFNTELQNLSVVQGQLGATGAATWEAQTVGAGAAAQAAKTTSDATEEANVSLRSMYSQWIAIGIAVALVEKTIVSALETAGKWERVTEALNATTQDLHGVADAMREIPALADNIGVSIESVQQGFVRLARYGLDLKSIPEILTDIQSGAIASGTSFDTVANAWERAINTGTIMTRTVQNMGLNMRDLAAAMGMVGRTDAEVSAAFKGIQDNLDGTTAAAQRTAILMAALPEKVSGLATSVDDTTKSITQLGNAFATAKDQIGTALEQIGQGGGVTALRAVIQTIETAILGLITAIGELVTTVVGFGKIAVDVFVGLGKVIADALTGNLAMLALDVRDTGQKIASDWAAMGTRMASEFTTTGKILNDMWGQTATVATTSTATVGTTAAGMADKVAQAGASVKQTTDAMVSNFNQLGTVANQALQNAVTEFDKMAAAFFSGVGSATEYTKALKALDTAQKDVNAGIENQKTSMLLVANTYREMGVAVTNANITLKATVDDMANGQASTTQYTAALKALNKAQEEMNGGFQNAHTAALLVLDDYRTLGVTLQNAETWLKAVYNAYLNHKATLGELEGAITAVDKAQTSLNNGLQNYSTVLVKVSTDYANLQNALINAETHLRAVNEALQTGHADLTQLSAAVDAYVKAQTAATGGIETWESAELKLIEHHKNLEVSLQNANTELSKATGLYNSGAIGVAEYTKYVDAAKSAHDALYGAHKQQSQAVSELTSALQAYIQAQINATNAAQNALGMGYQLQTQQLNLETTLRQANTELERATELFNQGAIGSGVLQKAVQAVDAALKNLGTSTQGVTSDMREAVTALQNASQAMDQIGSSASAAGSAISGLRGQVESLGSELDRSMNVTPGNLSVSSAPGSTWDFSKAIQSAQFAALVEFGGPASIGNVSNWATSGVAGTPQEIADLQLKQAQALDAAQKALQQLIASAHGTSTAVTSLGAAATTAAGKLDTTYQNAFTALQAATDAYQNHVIDLPTYDKAVQAYKDAYAALTGVTLSAATTADALGMLATTTTSTTAAVSDATDKALAELNAVQAAYQNGTATMDDLNKAWQKYDATLTGPMMSLGTTLMDLNGSLQSAVPAMDGFVNSLGFVQNFFDTQVGRLTGQVGGSMALVVDPSFTKPLSDALNADMKELEKLRVEFDKLNVNEANYGTKAYTLQQEIEAMLAQVKADQLELNLAANNPIRTILPSAEVLAFGRGGTNLLANQGVNITVNIPGTIVGPGGISGVTQAISNELINQLARTGIRLTRG